MFVDVQTARALLAFAVIAVVVPVQAYQLPGAEQPLPVGYEPIAPGSGAVGATQAPSAQYTPDVARAREEHLAAVHRAVARTRASAGGVVPLTLSAPQSAPTWSAAAPWAATSVQDNGPTDSLDVIAEKTKHFAAVEAAKRRLLAPDQPASLPAPLPTPVEYTPEVAQARADHFAAVAAAEARNAAEDRAAGIASTVSPPTEQYASPQPQPQVLTKVHASHFAHAGFLRPRIQPQPVAVTPTPYYQPAPQFFAPAPAPVPVAGPVAHSHVVYSSNQLGEDDGQYRGNEEPSSGEYSYSYSDGLSSKTESRTADGITRGSYSYYDANGALQQVSYEADDVNGFRVYGSNVPQVSPAVAAALANPEDPGAAAAAASAGAIPDTPDVVAAKQAFFAAYNEALHRLQTENH